MRFPTLLAAATALFLSAPAPATAEDDLRLNLGYRAHAGDGYVRVGYGDARHPLHTFPGDIRHDRIRRGDARFFSVQYRYPYSRRGYYGYGPHYHYDYGYYRSYPRYRYRYYTPRNYYYNPYRYRDFRHDRFRDHDGRHRDFRFGRHHIDRKAFDRFDRIDGRRGRGPGFGLDRGRGPGFYR